MSRGKGARPIVMALAAFALVISGAVLAAPALADSAPINPNDPKTPVTVTADSLPTAQHDGVAWQAVTLGNTVYVAGSFSNARPYGAAPGTQLVSRRNLMAFDLTSGLLKSNFAPVLNGQALSIAASPDGSRIYVGGDFTTVNGVQRNRIAAFDPSNGSLISSFAPKVAASVRAIVASNSTVWFGGTFNAVGSVARNRLAAVSASNGALLPWAPNADGGRVNALALSPTADRVVVGGAFTTLNGLNRPGYGLGMVNSATGATLAIQVNDVVRDAGEDSAILSSPRTAASSTAPAISSAPEATWRAPSRPTGRTPGSNGSKTATATPTRPSRTTRRSTWPGTRTTA